MEREKQEQEQTAENKSGYIRLKKFHFIMLLFFIVFISAGITTVALSFGEEKVVTVSNDREEFTKLYKAFDTLKNGYYKKINEQELINGAINGMVESLDDPYSDYMTKDEAESFHSTISSSFEGIGAEIQEKDGHIMIVSPIKNSPAEKAGLKPNDIILSVDGKSLQGVTSTKAVTMIRGKKGTKVELSIQRPGSDAPITVPIIRDEIPIETVYGEMVDDRIAKVQITSFSTNTTKELTDKLNELKSKGMQGLVLDLRQNPGGLLDQAINISSMFVPKGKIIVKEQDRNGKVKEIASQNDGNPGFPLVVLIDKGSASASEILAAAVKESAGVPLVGEKSFGKGTVQTAADFSDGSNIKYTIAKWLTPNGNWIHKKGIKPDMEVALPEYANLPIINPEKELTLSTSSTEVQTAQKMLKALGYDPGREDGFFDEKTKKAVMSFQTANQLTADGILKGETTLKLMEKIRELINNNDTQLNKAIEVLKEKMK
ncbi:S41 family peptidase [Bacillus thermocopriae]|uniref:S41 family peptidase n=2 Tax=Neobacillus thermocopriae TaxID=1215031 RepID=A0A6B3TSE4_9BACI|nr:S41 family peptidase [Neobacillus thermocopriae]MED3625458.1 S41 family peptidase [Neobacillus thermocopriae]NEX78931.1 S41 family peptidase [Neobacillus thermocopriae]